MTSVVEITVLWASNLPVNPVLFRLLRIGKLARAIRNTAWVTFFGVVKSWVNYRGFNGPVGFEKHLVWPGNFRCGNLFPKV